MKEREREEIGSVEEYSAYLLLKLLKPSGQPHSNTKGV